MLAVTGDSVTTVTTLGMAFEMEWYWYAAIFVCSYIGVGIAVGFLAL